MNITSHPLLSDIFSDPKLDVYVINME